MRISTLVLSAAFALPTAAFAQTVKENYRYSAPSGMFGEGTAKWQTYRTMQEDRERLLGLSSGSVQGATTSQESVRRPGEANTRRGGPAN